MCIVTHYTTAHAATALATLNQREMDAISLGWINATSPTLIGQRNAIDPKLVALAYAVCEYFADCTADEMSAMALAAAFEETTPMPLTPVLRREHAAVRAELLELRAALTP